MSLFLRIESILFLYPFHALGPGEFSDTSYSHLYQDDKMNPKFETRMRSQ